MPVDSGEESEDKNRVEYCSLEFKTYQNHDELQLLTRYVVCDMYWMCLPISSSQEVAYPGVPVCVLEFL